MSLVVIGSIGLDTISTPAGAVVDALGGSAIYGALSGSYFCPVKIVGVLGTDFPVSGLELLQKHGVNLDGLDFKEGKTFRWSGKYNNWNKAETLNTELNVFADFAPILPESYKSCKSLLLGNIHPELQLQVLSQIESDAHLACDTMNYWINRCPEDVAKVIQRVDIVFMNEDEVRDFTGRADIFSAARDILSMGTKWVIVKRGEYGSVALSIDEMYFTPAYPVEKVKDPTGAGDCFAGAFMAYLSNCGELNRACIKNAVLYGTILAAMNVQDFSVNGIIEKNKASIDADKELLTRWTN
ncbi:MAG: PfkB family carbohydrate kinase [Candidatus Cloacimonetes bacterium]|nr:PfkB family carbohydrate kinase [Candidatus Cloacimonadota bacterium]